ATLNAATLLASALATNSICPSGVRLRLLGVFPTGAAGYSEQAIVSSPLPFATSSTLTFVELAQATNSVLPSAERTISVGCFSVGQVSMTLRSSRLTTATAALFHRLTKRSLPPGSATQA